MGASPIPSIETSGDSAGCLQRSKQSESESEISVSLWKRLSLFLPTGGIFNLINRKNPSVVVEEKKGEEEGKKEKGWKGILGFDYGIMQAPLGSDISGPELVAAVANAGGIGLLSAPEWDCPEYVKDLIKKTRALTNKPFGIGIVLAFPHEENLKAILEEKVEVLQLDCGEVSEELVRRAHDAGVKVVPQVGTFEAAEKAINVGVDAIIIKGFEAGGHVMGQDTLITSVVRVAQLIGKRDIPVIAAGGIVNARCYVAALALGARGVSLGTRFVATEESNAHPMYKNKLVEYQNTKCVDLYGRARWPGASHRVLLTPFFRDWRSLPANEDETSQPVIGCSTIHGKEVEIRRFAGIVPNKTTTGDIESMVMYAGQGVGGIKEILPAGEVVRRIVEEGQLLIRDRLKNPNLFKEFRFGPFRV